MDIENGEQIAVFRNGRTKHTMLVREGCSGSPNCALEMYVAKGESYVTIDCLNLHLTDDEMEAVYQAVKAVRKARRKTVKKRHNKDIERIWK